MSTAVVTGANRGIGLELCRQLRERGYDVVGACRKSSADLQNTGARVVAGIDVTEAESVRRLAAELAPKSVDLLINNAGRLGEETLGSIDYQSVIDQFATNAVGPLRVTEALLPKLASGAKVALITSRMGSITDNTSGAFYGYRMSKAALNAAGKSLMHDLQPQGIAVIILHPGYVSTRMTSNHGQIETDQSAKLLLQRIDQLTLETSGKFFHANGEELPW